MKPENSSFKELVNCFSPNARLGIITQSHRKSKALIALHVYKGISELTGILSGEVWNLCQEVLKNPDFVNFVYQRIGKNGNRFGK